MILIAILASVGVAFAMAAEMSPVMEETVASPAPTEQAVPAGDGLGARFPDFVAGLQDCLDHLTLREAADLTQRGVKLGNDNESYAIMYPEIKQPHDFIVSVTSVNGDYSCSGQGPTSMPTDQIEAELGALSQVVAGYNMAQLNFPAPTTAFADCENDVGILFTDSAGTLVFAGFAGQNATTYCTAFGVKE